jgi:penicillin amidase
LEPPIGYTALMRSSPASFGILLLLGLSVFFLVSAADQVKQVTTTVAGLTQPVEILRDRWGVPHIYAQNQQDLFFAQGYITAEDRLFQLDLWRRIGAGKLSEVLGPNYLARDRIARLVQYRGDWDAEWRSYSPDAKQIATAFTNGINAYILSLHGQRTQEFQLAGFDPGLWTPRDVVSRVDGLKMTGNMLGEVNRALQVARIGLPTVKLLSPPDPPTEFAIPRGLDLGDISSRIVRDYVTAIGPLRFPGQQGSNNWVVDGTMSRTGKPILANDPHRALTLPSLRKTVQLVAPGWDVIGAGDPALPGISLGHNQDIAFGFTLVGIDQQDLYVEKLKPDDPHQYLYKGAWLPMRVEHDSIDVKEKDVKATPGAAPSEIPTPVELCYTIHGPVIYEDLSRHRAYSLKWAGMLPGTAAYLPGLSLARAKNWQDFQTAAARYKVPSENLAYADQRGNIGWIASGLAPVREGWEGIFPVPGDTGEYEWKGFLNPKDHPSEFNPPDHYIATANNNILPEHYPHELAYYWASPERYQRIVEMLGRKKKFDVDDFELMQQDTVSLVARDFLDLLRVWHPAQGSQEASIRAQVLDWDCNVSLNSKAALIYEIWHARLNSKLTAKILPAPRIHPREVMESLKTNPELPELLSSSLEEALSVIERRLGADQSHWTWGNLHKAIFRHPLTLIEGPPAETSTLSQFGLDSAAARRQRLLDSLEIPPVSRPGDANTVNATGGGPNFTEAYGATYRQIIDVQNWDRSVMTNAPGESGVPGSKHYDDLVMPWAKGEYHPMPFSRKAVEAATEERILLQPAAN